MLVHMKILHTSDWHLGRSFGTYGLLPDQEAFLAWFVSVAVDQGVELVVIAGDIYDRTTPPADAMRAFDHTISSLTAAGIEVAAISGNHDSADRVAMYSSSTEANGLILRGGFPTTSTGDADVVVRNYSDGPLAIAAIPFLDPRMMPADFSLLDPANGPFSHNAVVTACAKAAIDAIPSGMRSVSIAHGFIAGGKGSDSERTPVITVGNTDHIGAEVFEGFSYSALGHLHRPQIVRGSETIRYSGTPLPYSFSETGDKSVVLVDMDSAGECQISLIEVPVGRGVRTVTGRFDELVNMETDDAHLVRVDLSDPAPVPNAKRRLEEVFPYLIELRQRSMQTSLGRSEATSNDGTISLARQVEEFLRTATQAEPQIDQFNLVVEALTDAGAELGDVDSVRSDLIDIIVSEPVVDIASEQAALDLWGNQNEGVA